MTLRRGGSVGISVLAMIAALIATPTQAAENEVTITQGSAIAGGVTPGDEPGFPITISEPGHYRLVSGLIPPADTDGIVIKSDNVTLDFGGMPFTMKYKGVVSASEIKFTIDIFGMPVELLVKKST